MKQLYCFTPQANVIRDFLREVNLPIPPGYRITEIASVDQLRGRSPATGAWVEVIGHGSPPPADIKIEVAEQKMLVVTLWDHHLRGKG